MVKTTAFSWRVVLALVALMGAALACATPNSGPSDNDAAATADYAEQVAATAAYNDTQADNLAATQDSLEATLAAVDEADVEVATATPEPEDEGEAIDLALRPAELVFDLASATVDGDGDANWLLAGCWPPNSADEGSTLALDTDTGSIVGHCTQSDTGQLDAGTLTGYSDQEDGGALHLTVVNAEVLNVLGGASGSGTVVTAVTYEALTEIDGDTAQGDASFTYTCTSTESGVQCPNGEVAWTFTGTVPFTFSTAPSDQ